MIRRKIGLCLGIMAAGMLLLTACTSRENSEMMSAVGGQGVTSDSGSVQQQQPAAGSDSGTAGSSTSSDDNVNNTSGSASDALSGTGAFAGTDGSAGSGVSAGSDISPVTDGTSGDGASGSGTVSGDSASADGTISGDGASGTGTAADADAGKDDSVIEEKVENIDSAASVQNLDEPSGTENTEGGSENSAAADWNGTYSSDTETVTISSIDDTAISFGFAQSGITGKAEVKGSQAIYHGDDYYVVVFDLSGSTLEVSVASEEDYDATGSPLIGTYTKQ